MTAPGARSPAGDSPPPELVARFREELDRLCAFWPDQGKMGLAVSGGPDSLAMMLLAEAAIPHQFEVATVDHGLRSESADECAAVAAICEARSIPCTILKVEVEPGNVQANARAARYRTLGVSTACVSVASSPHPTGLTRWRWLAAPSCSVKCAAISSTSHSKSGNAGSWRTMGASGTFLGAARGQTRSRSSLQSSRE